MTIKLRKIHTFFETKHIILELEFLFFRSRFILCSPSEKENCSFLSRQWSNFRRVNSINIRSHWNPPPPKKKKTQNGFQIANTEVVITNIFSKCKGGASLKCGHFHQVCLTVQNNSFNILLLWGKKYNDLPKEIYLIRYKSSLFASPLMDMYFYVTSILSTELFIIFPLSFSFWSRMFWKLNAWYTAYVPHTTINMALNIKSLSSS